MKLFRLAFIGFLLQLFGIAGFIAASRTSIGTLGKPAIIMLVAISIALVIWASFKVISLRGSVVYLPGLLAVDYVIAFHIVGITTFPGLLRDWRLSLDYFVSLLRVAGVAFVLFAVASILLLLLKRAIDSHNDVHQN